MKIIIIITACFCLSQYYSMLLFVTTEQQLSFVTVQHFSMLLFVATQQQAFVYNTNFYLSEYKSMCLSEYYSMLVFHLVSFV